MRRLLRLYPPIWRERYEEEMLAVLEEHQVTAATVIDLLVGALDARLYYSGVTKGVFDMVNRLRSGIVMFFWAFMMFGLGWSLLQRINDPVNLFQAAAKSNPEIIMLHRSILIVGCLAFLVFCIGGLPVFYLSVKKAIKNQQKNVLIPFLITYFIVFLVLLLLGTISVSLMISRTDFEL